MDNLAKRYSWHIKTLSTNHNIQAAASIKFLYIPIHTVISPFRILGLGLVPSLCIRDRSHFNWQIPLLSLCHVPPKYRHIIGRCHTHWPSSTSDIIICSMFVCSVATQYQLAPAWHQQYWPLRSCTISISNFLPPVNPILSHLSHDRFPPDMRSPHMTQNCQRS